MLDYKIPIILPSYLCRSGIFPNFVSDLVNYRIKNIIVTVDYDINKETPAIHFSKMRLLRSNLKELSKEKSAKFKVHTNFLMENILYSPLDIRAIASKKSNLFFMTLPLGTNAEVAMKNIFVIKNLGYVPIILNFESVAAFYPQSFCKALLTTENIYFGFNPNNLDDPRIDSYIKTALTSHNTVFFMTSDFASTSLYKKLEHYTRLLPKKQKLNFIGTSAQIIKKMFR